MHTIYDDHEANDSDERVWEGDHLPDELTPSFNGGRQEKKWIEDALGDFYSDGWLDDVTFRVKGGKEATVYCCAAHPSTGFELLAAKVMRPRMFRAMKNDSLYRIGRTTLDAESKTVLDHRSIRALEKGTRYGRKLATASWCQHEFKALQHLHAAGADVPKPLACAPNALLMEFIGDRDGAAPILHSVRLTPAEAQPLLDRMLENVEIMLRGYRVHGDLSAYNVLYWEGEARIIDFPQTIDALRHPEAYRLFARDIDRLCRYFGRQGIACDPDGIAHEIWETVM